MFRRCDAMSAALMQQPSGAPCSPPRQASLSCTRTIVGSAHARCRGRRRVCRCTAASAGDDQQRFGLVLETDTVELFAANRGARPLACCGMHTAQAALSAARLCRPHESSRLLPQGVCLAVRRSPSTHTTTGIEWRSTRPLMIWGSPAPAGPPMCSWTSGALIS